MYINCKTLSELQEEILDPLSVPEDRRYWDTDGGRITAQTPARRNSRKDCRRPNAESLVRQLYAKCRVAKKCDYDDNQQLWESVYEIFSRFSYISPQLRNYTVTKEFRKKYMFDGKILSKNTNKYFIVSNRHGDVNQGLYPFGLANIDSEKFPDPYYRGKNNQNCPVQAHTLLNCWGECRKDNCYENPPAKWQDIDYDYLVPRIISIELKDFINADLKDFLDPFKGQLGYDTTTKEGAVRNKDGSFTYYHRNNKLIRSVLTRVSKWTGGDHEYDPDKGKFPVWDGVGLDPYKKMGGESQWDYSKNGHILPTGKWYAPSAVINDAWYYMALHGIAWYCMVLLVLHNLAISCTIFHYIPL